MKSLKIIGLPVIVSEKHRIVLDHNIRSLYGIEKDAVVIMKIIQGFLYILPFYPDAAGDKAATATTDSSGEKKVISIGRFNLPQSWVRQNQIDIGDFVYLIATDSGILVCPKNLELICMGGSER